MSGSASIRIYTAQVLAVLAVFGAIATTPAWAHEEGVPAAFRSDQGMVYRGLKRATSGPCKGGYVANLEFMGSRCTHGPDPAPAVGGLLTSQAPFSRYFGPAKSVPCIGNGDSGPRIELIYAHAADTPDNYAEAVPQLVEIAEEMTAATEESAAETGGFRTLRFETAGCLPVVRDVTLTTSGDDDLSAMANDLNSLGFNRADRDYLTFVDASVYCGIAFFDFHYARVDRGCWGAHTALHELTHTFGAVYNSAPNASGGSHCTDEYDVMCYSDEPYFPAMHYVCPEEHERLLDCHHDDYFSTDPQPGNFLFANPDLNAAESPFLAMRDGEPATFLPEFTSFYAGRDYTVRAYNADDELCVYGEGTAVPRRTRLFCVAYLSERTADVTAALVALAGGSGNARLRLVGTDGGGGRTFGFTVSENGKPIFDEHEGVAGVQSSNRPLGAVDPSTGMPVFYEHVLDLSLSSRSQANRRACAAAKRRVQGARRGLAAFDRSLSRRYQRLRALRRRLRDGHGSLRLARRYTREYRAYRRALHRRAVLERRLRALQRAAAARCSG